MRATASLYHCSLRNPARATAPATRATVTAPSAPFVSVVMPVYNAGRFVAQAVESVLAQTYPAFELVVVDDASSDGSFELLQTYAARDARVRVFRQPSNQGIVAARNRAFREARPDSRYFAILDSDDVALPDRLERQVEFLRAHPDHALVGGHTLIIDEDSRPLGIRRYPVDYAQICAVITRYNPIAQPAVTLRRSVLEQVGSYSPQFPRCQDYELWLRIAAQYPIANLDVPVIRYRISATQGKRTHLRQTLALTLSLQRRWLLHARFRRSANLVYVFAGHMLMLVPERLVLGLFKRVTYAPK
jgi:glycosyltransferase involved in cell wall biosynthesis